MKKETKRYMVVEYCDTKKRVYDSKEELDAVLENIRKYNRRVTTKYICGNISVEEIGGKYYVNIHLYHKLTGKSTISEIDGFTSKFNKDELEMLFAPQLKTNEGYEPDINIAYFETENEDEENEKPLLYGVRYIPVLYKDDCKYLDDNFIKKCLMYHSNRSDVGFFKDLANEFSPYHAVGDSIEQLYIYCNKVENEGYDPINLYYISLDLYKKLIVEREKDGTIYRDEKGKYQISARRKRDFGLFLKYYDARKKRSPLKYNGSTTTKSRMDTLFTLYAIKTDLVNRINNKEQKSLRLDMNSIERK